MSRYLTDEELSIIRASVPKYGGGHMKALIAEVERLRAEVSYLRACVPPVHPGDYGNEAWTEAIRAYVAEERAAVVAWLRGDAGFRMVPGNMAYCDYYADAIERGEHRREEDK